MTKFNAARLPSLVLLHKAIKEIKRRFAHTIKNYLTLVTYREHVFKPVPEAVFEQKGSIS